MKSNLWNVVIIVVFILTTSFVVLQPVKNLIPEDIKYVKIAGQEIKVDLALDTQTQEQGLSGRTLLKEDEGMLFIFQISDTHPFWMKDMNFPIDIIWIRDTTIVDISKNVPVATTAELPTYAPREPVNKVLEVRAGDADRYGFKIGDAIKIGM